MKTYTRGRGLSQENQTIADYENMDLMRKAKAAKILKPGLSFDFRHKFGAQHSVFKSRSEKDAEYQNNH